jgi:hypothetical protein
MSGWRRFRELPREERRALMAAAARLAVVHTLLGVTGVARTRRMLSGSAARVDRVAAERAARAVQRAANHVPLRTNCLDRALTVWWMLHARGLEATLQIGVRKVGDATIEAHAWVEHGGQVLLDELAADFASLGTAHR